uniref:Translation initiation factor eIF2 assembly protein n=1 Tax=Pavo cristatus TaxID=9049 RepID=A0A8C9L9Y2_PAVCR
MKKEQVAHCQFSVWYPLFRAVTIPEFVFTRILEKRSSFCSSWGATAGGCESRQRLRKEELKESAWVDPKAAPEFPEFTAKVEEAISSLGGSVFPKLNWSAPRDAYWIAMNSSLKCKALSDIFLLFKSSDFITRDLTQPFIHCTDDSPDPSLNYELVLRKWCELIPGAEFRCFVKENKLIDFNPFGEVTDSLLFTWDELTSGRNLKGDQSEGEATEQDCPVFRCTNSQVTVQPSPYLSYRLPKDFVDLSTGEDVHKLIDFLKLVRSTRKL